MTPPAASTRTLSTADERRETVLEAAMTVFAERGFSGTPTTAVAQAAGISHAYLFRLYPTKSELAVAVIERCHELVHQAFARAAAGAKATGADPLEAMGAAYEELVADRRLVLVQLHGHAASPGDEAIRDASRACFGRLIDFLTAETGADAATVGSFMATGMLINVMVALDVPAVDAPWAHTLMAFSLDDTC